MTDLVPVELLFCKTDMLLSKLIIWGLDQPASHVGIDLPSKGWVAHSDLLGVHKVFRAQFLREHTVIATFKLLCTPAQQAAIESKFLAFLDAATGESYDYGAFTYFTYRAILKKITDKPIPAANPWQGEQEALCTEVAYLLNEAVVEVTGKTLYPYSTDLAATSPWDLRALLIKTAGGNENELDLRTLGPSRVG